MSSKLRIIFTDFIESIPDEKLLGFSDTAGKVHTTRDYYLQNLGRVRVLATQPWTACIAVTSLSAALTCGQIER
ncbi:hypothetical protein MYU51_021228 [Penicillium brevicompactum]